MGTKRCSDPEELEECVTAQRNGVISNWCYDNPVQDVTVGVNDVTQFLERSFLDEANTDLDRVTSDIRSRGSDPVEDDRLEKIITPLSCLITFLSDCILEKLRYVTSRVPHKGMKRSTIVPKTNSWVW